MKIEQKIIYKISLFIDILQIIIRFATTHLIRSNAITSI